MVFCDPLPLTEHPGSESTFANLLRKDLSILPAGGMFTAFVNISFENKRFINERLPALFFGNYWRCVKKQMSW